MAFVESVSLVNCCKMSDRGGFRCSPVFLLLLLVPAFVFLGYRGTTSVPTSLRVSMTTPGTSNPAVLQRLSKKSAARCIDGSLPSYYIRHGTGSGRQKWVIFFEGGGWCYNLEQCYLRSKTRLGSSRGYPEVLSEEHLGYYVSSDEQINPLMHNWNTVYVNYCDGSSFAGDTAVPYKGGVLHFRGRANRDETIRSLFSLRTERSFKTTVNGTPMDVNIKGANMTTATEVVIAGCSAGALGVLMGLDSMADIVRSTAAAHGNTAVTVRGLVDSGYFMERSSTFRAQMTHHSYGKDEAVTETTRRVNGDDRMDYAVAMRDVFQFMNISAGAHPACLAAHATASTAHRRLQSNESVVEHSEPATNTTDAAPPPLPAPGSPPSAPLPVSPTLPPQQAATPPVASTPTAAAPTASAAASQPAFSPQSDCVFARNLVPHTRTPMFLLQPQYDQWQILHIFSQNYTAEEVNAYGRALLQSMKPALFHASHPGHGAFVDSCSHHCTSCSDPVENTWSGSAVRSTISVPGSSQLVAKVDWNEAEAFQVWYEKSLLPTRAGKAAAIEPGVNWFFQDRPYPCSDCCKCSVDMVAQLRRNHLRS